MSWIRLISLEIDSVKETDYIKPTREISENERVIGQANDDVKSLFTLLENIKVDVAGLYAKMMLSSNQDEAMELKVKISELMYRSEIFRKLMWVEINDSLDTWSIVNIGIRKDWQIVEIPTIGMTPEDFLRKFLGG